MENRSQKQPEQQQLQELSPKYPTVELLPHQQYQVDVLWKNHNQEVEQMTDFKTHQLPVTRIRRVMKAGRGVDLVSSEAPVMIAKACEMFIQDLTLRAWIDAEENDMSTLEPINFYDAICHTSAYKFLILPSGTGNSSGGSSSSEVRTRSQYPSVGETNPYVIPTAVEAEQPFGVNLGTHMDEELWLQPPAQGRTGNP